MAIVNAYFDFILACFSSFTSHFLPFGFIFSSFSIVFLVFKVFKIGCSRGEKYD